MTSVRRSRSSVRSAAAAVGDVDEDMQTAILESWEETRGIPRRSPSVTAAIKPASETIADVDAGTSRNMARRSASAASAVESSHTVAPDRAMSAAIAASLPTKGNASTAGTEGWRSKREEDYTEEDIARIAESLESLDESADQRAKMEQKQRAEREAVERLSSVDDTKYEKLNVLLDKTTLFSEFLEKDRIKKVASKAALAAKRGRRGQDSRSSTGDGDTVRCMHALLNTACDSLLTMITLMVFLGEFRSSFCQELVAA